MTTHELVQQAINGLADGSSLALLALGLAMVFGVMRLINFAHGELLTIGGYTMWATLAHGVPWPAVIPLTLLATTLAAIAMERIAFRPLRRASVVTLLITSFAIGYLLQVVFQIAIAPAPQGIRLPAWVNDVTHLGSYAISTVKLLAGGVTLLALGLFTAFLRRTTYGISIRAAAEDFDAVRLQGVRADRVVALAFALSGLLAGVAALLFFAQTSAVDPATGTAPIVKAFIAAVLGGLGSLVGAVAGAFVLGFAEVIMQATLPGAVIEYRDALLLALVVCLLLVKPAGLVGRTAEP